MGKKKHTETTTRPFFCQLLIHVYKNVHSHKGKTDILGKMGFWCHCKEHILSFNFIPSCSYIPHNLCDLYDLLCRKRKQFLWNCDFDKFTLKVSYIFGIDRPENDLYICIGSMMKVFYFFVLFYYYYNFFLQCLKIGSKKKWR